MLYVTFNCVKEEVNMVFTGDVQCTMCIVDTCRVNHRFGGDSLK